MDDTRPGYLAMQDRLMNDPIITHVFIYGRDRSARPRDPAQAVSMENRWRSAGKTLVMQDEILGPLQIGEYDLASNFKGLTDYQQAGQYLVDHAQRIIAVQQDLARNGFTTGGRASYGFARVLVGPDGAVMRKLRGKEYVREEGCHVRILPDDEEKIAIRLMMFDWKTDLGWGDKRIANELNKMGIPSPDAGRKRRDKHGWLHEVPGKWTGGTVRELTADSKLLGIQTYGTRSEGRIRRVSPDGYRPTDRGELSNAGKPRVVRNQKNAQTTGKIGFEPLVSQAKFEKAQEIRQKRSKSQRGQTRARDPYRYPLSGRVIDLDCGWPMWGMPVGKRLYYKDGRYHATAGAECNYWRVEAQALTKTLLSCLRTQVLLRQARPRLQQKLRQIAASRLSNQDKLADQVTQAENKVASAQEQHDKVTKSLAMENDPKRRNAITPVWDQFDAQLEIAKHELERLRQQAPEKSPSLEEEVNKALAVFDDLEQLSSNAEGPELMRLIGVLNVMVWLKFTKIKPKKRVLNKLDFGLITTGETPWPRQPYNGPRSVSAGMQQMADNENDCEEQISSQSLQKAGRGDRI